MQSEAEVLTKIKNLLTENPKGMTTEDIAKSLPLNRTSTAKYLNTLLISGQIGQQVVGRAKLFKCCNRLPMSQLLSFSSDPVIVVDHELMVREINSPFIEIFGTPKKDVIGKKFNTLTSEVGITNILMSGICNAVEGESFTKKHEVEKGDKIFHFRTKYLPIVLDDGRPGAAVILENVTETHQIQQKYEGIIKKTVKRTLRDGGEEQLAHSPAISPNLSEQSQAQLIHELQVHQIELETQAEELRKSKLALEESRDRFVDLYEFAPLGYLTLTEKALITEVNLTGAKLLGVVRDKLINHGLGRFIAPKDNENWDRYFADVRQHGEKQSCTLTLKRSDGSTFPARLEGIRLTDSDDTITVRIAFSDITDIRKAEAALRDAHDNLEILVQKRTDQLFDVNRNLQAVVAERAKTDGTLSVSDEQLALAIERSGVGLWDWYVQTGKTTFNERWAEIVGYTLAELSPVSIDTWINLCHPDDLKQSDELLNKHFKKQSSMYVCEARIRHKDGHWVWVLDLGKVIEWDSAGLPIRMTGTHLDISGRKVAEEVLLESETKHRALFEAIADTVFLIDQKSGRIIDVNPAGSRVFGYSRDEFIRMKLVEISEEPEQTLKSIKDGTTYIPLRYYHRKDGSVFPVEITASTFELKGRNTFLATIRDISDRKRAEKALADSESFNRNLVENLPDYVVLYGSDGKIIYVNPAAERGFGYNAEEVIGTSVLSYVAPECRDEVAANIAVRRDGGDTHAYETVLITHDGQRRTVLAKGTQVHYHDVTTTLLLLIDITERKVAEVVLQRQSASLAILNGIISTANNADNLPQLLKSILTESLHLLDFDAGAIYLVDHSTRTANIVHSENLPKEFLAETQTVSIDKKPYDTLFIKNEPVITENYAKIAPALSKKFGFQSLASIPLFSKGVAIGALNLASMSRHVISDEEKQTLISVSRELGSTIERMAAEEEVKKAKENLETLFNSIDEMVFVLDMQGIILAINDVVSKRLSYTQRELTGTNVLLLHVPERRDEALRIVQGMIAGTIDSCPVPVIAKDGTRIEVETQVTRGCWNGNEVLIGVSRDVTERKRVEEALRESEERFDQLAEQSNTITWEVDLEGLYTYVSHVSMAVWGYRPDELVGRMHFYDLHPESGREEFKASCFAVFARKESFRDMENSIQSRDGREVWVSTNGIPLLDADGTLRGYRGSDTDITDRIRAEEKRALLQSQFENAMDVGNLAWWEMDRKSGSVRFYKKKAEMLGYPPEQFSHFTDFTCLLHPDDHDRVMQAMRDHFNGKKLTYETEYRIKTASGEYRWFWDVGGISEYDASGQPVKVMGIVIDITERKRTEEALHLSDSAVVSSISAIALADLNGTVTYVNPAYLSICGYEDPQEIIGRSMLSFWKESDQIQSVADRIQEHGNWSGEMAGQKKDGSPMQIFVSAHLVLDASGAPVAMMGSFIDITVHKETEMALLEGEQQYRALFDTITEGVILIAPEGQIVSANPAAEYILGLTHSEIEGRKYDSPDWDLLRPDGTLMPPKEFASARAMKEKSAVMGVVMGVKRPVGSVFWINVNAVPLLDETGALKGGVVTFQNITERKRTEEELLQLTQQLSLLTDITRHDILNKVTEVIGHLNHARKTFSDPEITALIDTIETNTKEIKSQIEFTRVYQTLGTLEPQWQNPDYLISQLHIPSHITLQSALLGVEIFADPLFKQVFFNLFDNSQRHGGHVTTITVSMENNRFGLIIYIEDNGVGIPAKQKKKCFERGFKKSTGLGLFLTQEILRITGIRIQETGIEGSGARFEIIVPKGVYRNT